MILALMLLLLGIVVLMYPTVSSYVNQLHGSYVIQNLRAETEALETEEVAAQRRLAEAYNAALAAGNTDGCENYGDILNFAGGVMGYLEIPKIRINLPICHGVSDEVLEKAVGHLPQSAFPIGGEGNHTVLTGHTGLPGARLFTDWTDLEEGDVFYIHILEQTLVYQVDQIRVVLPSEADALWAVPGEDCCTLVTCTPYGINSHRLLVRGTRVEQFAQTEVPLTEDAVEKPAMPVGIIAAMTAAAALLAGSAVVLFRKRKSENN